MKGGAPDKLVSRPLPENYQASEASIYQAMQTVELRCQGLLPMPKAFYYTEAQALFDASGKLFAPSLSYPSEAELMGRRFLWSRWLLKARRRIAAPCLLVTNKSSRNYYHWHCDVLPKIIAAQRSPQFLAGTRLLVPDGLLKQEFVQASLETFWRGAIEPLLPQSVYALPLAFFADALAPRLNQDPDLLQEVMQGTLAMQLSAAISTKPTRKLYIQRGAVAQAKRRIVNEAAVLELLTAHGFEAVEFERLSYAEQIRCSAECTAMVSINGAGLTNCLFMPAGGTVLEIRSHTPKANCYWTLANVCGHRYFYAIGERDENGPRDHIGSLTVDVAALAVTLDRMRSRPNR